MNSLQTYCHQATLQYDNTHNIKILCVLQYVITSNAAITLQYIFIA